jgi:hypothetical protein
MQLDAFRDFLDIHGSDPDAWPPHERRQAETLLRGSAEARRALEEAAGLDTLLTRTLSAGTAGAELRERILAGIPARPAVHRAAPSRWLGAFTLPWRIGTAAVTAALLFGIYAGASVPAPSDASFPVAQAEEIVDVADLAYGAGFHEDNLP